MDKAQKQLIDTYFRKRSIAVPQNSRLSWMNRELMYMIDNAIPFNLKILAGPGFVMAIKKNPSWMNKEYLKYFEDKLNVDDVEEILLAQPELMEWFKSFFDTKSVRDSALIANIIIKYPEYANKFDLKNIGAYNTFVLLMKMPELVKKVDLTTITQSKNAVKNIDNILERQPQLAKYLKQK